ncbi:acyl-[acyl-carrier-protein] thioesterase [Pontibacter ramchanderi]|uniref:Acyl-ACP thioesterase n=1 Tax=Pontibacter ramchanderi TaxID=1179743 RepID=A0A2N3UDC7_9BACT|nr:acyl-ACP thioesterase domain-containing protein [Pontibacter ramchanderi]PKV67380.1 acyl-ACP thioesterase [Pontibacter ramchanderi]
MKSVTGQSAFTIRSTETDQNGQATLSALVGYMQEAAWDNTATMGISMYELLERGLTWVLQRIRIEMFRYPRHREKITVETWASGRERVFLHRDFRVYSADRELLGQATSVWLVMDVVKRQMVSVPDFITAVEVVPGAEPLPFAKGKLPQIEKPLYEQHMPVRWHDIDLNRHVTNTRYLQWVLETLPTEVLEKQQLSEIDIIFKAESTLGDTVTASAGPAEEEAGTFLHKLISLASGKELVQAETKFRSLRI